MLAHVTDLLFAGASVLEPAEMLTAVCETVAAHLALANVVFWKRLAGQSRTLVWSAPDVPTPSRMFARERAWSSAAQLVDGHAPGALWEDGESVASTSVEDERLGLSAMLYVESRQALDRHDHALLEELLRQMLGLPEGEPRPSAGP